MGTDVKSLEIPWWLQLSKRQILTFLPRLSFGTVRSEVRILSPRPVKSSIYGCQHWRPYFICGQFVDTLKNHFLGQPICANISLEDLATPLFLRPAGNHFVFGDLV